MRDDDSFLAFVLDALRPWGSIVVRRMFGASGLFRDGGMVGFVHDDTLYLKVGEANRAAFEAAGSRPFVYEAKGRSMTMSFWNAPEAAMDDEEALRAVVAGAWAVACAGAAKTPKRSRARPKSGGKKAKG